MAITVTLQAEAYAFIDAGSPNSNSHSAQRQQIYYPDRTTRLLLRFARLPDGYKYRNISNLNIHSPALINNAFDVERIGLSDSDFDAANVTYNTRPSESALAPVDSVWRGWSLPAADVGTTREVVGSVGTPRSSDFYAVMALQAKTLWLQGISSLYSGGSQLEAYTPLASGKAPYITVDVGTEDKVLTPSALLPQNEYINPHEPQRFMWSNSGTSGIYSLETPQQVSAVLMFQVAGESSWREYPVSGPVTYADVPAETIPVSNLVKWKVQITDSTGHTAESSEKSIYTAAGTLTTEPSQPLDGYRVDPRNSFTFMWTRAQTGRGSDAASRTDLQWSPDEETWTDLAEVTGDALQVEIPANTFPSGALFWRARSYNVDGVAGDWSQNASFTTLDGTAVAIQISPVSEVVDGTAPLTFRWRFSNESGWDPSAVRAYWKLPSEDETQWHELVDTSDPATNFTVPGDYFQAGEIQWYVQAQNKDGVWGPAAQSSFVVLAAPSTPALSTDGAAFTTFRWQGSDQQAWRLTVDGKTYGPNFGTDRSYTLPDYLQDGEHTASVEIQGQYGLWSQAGQVTFQVSNSPGEPVTLTGSFGRDAALSWSTASETEDFLIYRDGVQIGHTAGRSYLDRFVLGQHDWQVINRLPDGNYTASDIVSGLLRSCTTAVALFSGGPWIEIPLSENSASEQRFSRSQTQSMRHMRGAIYPVLELSPYETGAGSYDCAFPNPQRAAPFEALFGHVVIVKSRGGNVVIGPLTGMDKRVKDFYISYTFEVQRCHWEDYVDVQNG